MARRVTALLLALVAFMSRGAPAAAQTAAPPSTEEAGLAVPVCPSSQGDVQASLSPGEPPKDACLATSGKGFGFGVAIAQAAGFTAFQHLVRLREAKTRRELSGPFVEEWITSASHLGRNWDDGGKIFTNYVAHPMGGAIYAHIYRQNDPRRIDLEVGEPGYGGMVWRAFTFSAAASVQFELGPLSEASIGNVGMRDPRKMAWVDLVITPAFGTAWMVGEDLIDREVLTRMDGKNVYLRNTARFFLNPSRSGANATRGKLPWYRARDSELYRRTHARK